jgi:hypothetical protein
MDKEVNIFLRSISGAAKIFVNPGDPPKDEKSAKIATQTRYANEEI